MSEPQQYTLRWRGRETGPFPVSEINRMLDEHEIGMGHEILSGDKWITLEDFFASPPKPSAPPPAQPPSSPTAAKSPWPTIPGPTLTLKGKTSPPPAKSPVFKPAELPQAPAGIGMAPGVRPRHRLVFALLGVFLGFLGAHNFYARQWLTGMLQLLLSLATLLMGFGIIATWVWAVVEAVVVRKDGDGLEMI